MENHTIEKNILIAIRVPPSDRWTLVDDPDEAVYPSTTDTLQAYFDKTGFKGSYRLDPLNSKLYAIETTEVEVEVKEAKLYSIFGEFKQGQ